MCIAYMYTYRHTHTRENMYCIRNNEVLISLSCYTHIVLQVMQLRKYISWLMLSIYIGLYMSIIEKG